MFKGAEFSIEASAIAVRRCTSTILKAVGRGELVGVRRGKRLFISAVELNRWAEDRGLNVSGKELAKLALRLVAHRQGREDAA
jgi:hypothetical protein